MRTIKFRGLTIDSKKWVYGFYTKGLDGTMYIEYLHLDEIIFDYIIIPETLGQFTGLQDKNGVDIYEGDILTKWDGLKKKVFFSDKHFNFQLSHLDNIGFCDTLSFWNQKSTEVIGNIHENPELV